MATKTKTDFLHEATMLAEVTWRRHIELYDGEKCFNVYMFLEDLANQLDGFCDDRAGRFPIDATEFARIVFCHMALNSGDDPTGTTFRGFPTLD